MRLILLFLALSSCAIHTPSERSLASSERLSRILTDFDGTSVADGPVSMADGTIYFDSSKKIFRINSKDEIKEVFSISDGKFSGMTSDHLGNLYASDYINHRIYKFSSKSGRVDFSKPEVVLENNLFSQPNDLVVTLEGNFILADAKWKRPKKGVLWFVTPGGNPIKLLEEDIPFVGIAYDSKLRNVYVATGGKDILIKCELDYSNTCKKIRKIKLGSKWSLDGMSVDLDSHRIYVSRIKKGRIDLFSPELKKLKTYCLLESRNCAGKTKLVGKGFNPSNVTYDSIRERLIITHFGANAFGGPSPKIPSHIEILDVSN